MKHTPRGAVKGRDAATTVNDVPSSDATHQLTALCLAECFKDHRKTYRVGESEGKAQRICRLDLTKAP